jgi:hypothetical protein
MAETLFPSKECGLILGSLAKTAAESTIARGDRGGIEAE